MTENNERVESNAKVITTEELERYLSERLGRSVVARKDSDKKSESKSVFTPVEVPNSKKTKEGTSEKTEEKPKRTRRKSTSGSRKRATKATGESTKKSSRGKSSKKVDAVADEKLGDDIYLDESTGLYYDKATGIALKDLYTDEEKKEYCDKKYGKGNWRKMSYEEFRRKFKMDMEIRAIANSFGSDDYEEEFW